LCGAGRVRSPYGCAGAIRRQFRAVRPRRAGSRRQRSRRQRRKRKAPVIVTRAWGPFALAALPSFSRRQAAAWNAVARSLAGEASWEKWITEGLAGLLETPAGFVIRLRQRHAVDPQQPESVFTSASSELTLGRDEGCDVRLAPRSVGNRHALL